MLGESANKRELEALAWRRHRKVVTDVTKHKNVEGASSSAYAAISLRLTQLFGHKGIYRHTSCCNAWSSSATILQGDLKALVLGQS